MPRQPRCFHVSVAKFLRTPEEHLRMAACYIEMLLSISDQCSLHIETSQNVSSVNHLPGFYVKRALIIMG